MTRSLSAAVLVFWVSSSVVLQARAQDSAPAVVVTDEAPADPAVQAVAGTLGLLILAASTIAVTFGSLTLDNDPAQGGALLGVGLTVGLADLVGLWALFVPGLEQPPLLQW
jgi:hypothetical protein